MKGDLSVAAGEESVGKKAAKAAKWSIVTQLVAKLISPITTMVLAHILAPEAFAVVATVTMVTSFAEMFSDAGFQKYLIQHDYESDDDYRLSVNVAFWSNLAVASLLWVVIGIFNAPIANLVGNPGLGYVIVVACASLPLVSLSSVQTAIYQRSFDFKTLFSSRVGSALVVLVVAVGMALLGFDYWSLIVSTIASNLFLAVWLTVLSPWKPSLSYSFAMLKQMISFSAWTLLECFAIWLTSWAGTFVLGVVMSAGYLGMYKTSVSLVSSITGLATSAINPIIFSSLSRLQGDRAKFETTFFLMQRYLAIVLVPLAVCLLVFRDMVVGILLGDQWGETALFFGLYAAASAIVVVFCHTASEAYRSLGKPRVSMMVQVCYLVVLVPSLYVSALQGYEFFSVSIPLIRAIGFTLIHFAFCRFAIGLSPLKMMAGQKWIYVISLIDGALCALLIPLCTDFWTQVPLLLLGVIFYLILVVFVRDTRGIFMDLCDRLGFGRIVRRLVPNSVLNR